MHCKAAIASSVLRVLRGIAARRAGGGAGCPFARSWLVLFPQSGRELPLAVRVFACPFTFRDFVSHSTARPDAVRHTKPRFWT
mmetsp:Transcript_3211/g.6367  ORF Transcript_3211/g.6367 Transcript_3211/m.6367 type:complete len:83 (+) Transcript_3211:1154-1402(+)